MREGGRGTAEEVFQQMKRMMFAMTAFVVMFAMLNGCRSVVIETKTLHCDRCGKAVEVNADSVMEEDWILYCSDCEKELGLDNLIP